MICVAFYIISQEMDGSGGLVLYPVFFFSWMNESFPSISLFQAWRQKISIVSQIVILFEYFFSLGNTGPGKDSFKEEDKCFLL